MSRLEGQKTSTGPIIVGAIIISLVAAGLFFAFRPASPTADDTANTVAVDNTTSNEVATDNSVTDNTFSTGATPIVGGGSSTPIPDGTPGAGAGGGSAAGTTSAAGGATNSVSAPGTSGAPSLSGTPGAQPTAIQILPTATSPPPVSSAAPVPTTGGNMAGATTGRPGTGSGTNNATLPSATAAPLTAPRTSATAAPAANAPVPAPTVAAGASRPQVGY